jgi:hypothetical protein
MNRIVSFAFCSFVWYTGMILCNLLPAFAQPLDMDLEERISADRPFIEETKAEIAAERAETRRKDVLFKEIREVKYVAGPDKKWFTKDDAVYEYFLLSYDPNGRLARKSGYYVGEDGNLQTADDVLHDYLVYEYDEDGKASRETLYDGKGAKQYTSVYGYDEAGQKSRMTRFDAREKETGSMNFFFGPAGLLLRDVEYKGSEIEKYHRFEYVRDHKSGKVTEYLGSAGGKGKDGVWFTDDDVVTSAKLSYYNQDGSTDKEKKFIEPGPDRKWFTNDDVLQYYTLFYYQ